MKLACVLLIIATQLKRYLTSSHSEHFDQTKWNTDDTDYTISDNINYVTDVECLHRCNMKKNCLRAVFESFEGEVIGECFLLRQAQKEDEVFVVEEYDMGEMIAFEARKAHVYPNCAAAFEDGRHVNQNTFLKKPLGWHYCAMKKLGECGDGGWTLAMTIDGKKGTFNYGSKYWTNSASFNATKALTSPLTTEAKYNAFSKMTAKSLCVGMKHKTGNTKYLKIDLENFEGHTTLLSIFRDNSEKILDDNRVLPESWLNLLETPLSARKICKQGFNIQASSTAQLRLGLFMSEDVCKTNWVDVWIGAGSYPLYCTEKYDHISAGAHCCLVVCNDRGELPLTYLFIK